MAARAPPYTVNLDIPVLAELIQSNRDLSREVSALRTQLSARLDAIEARLTTQDTDQSPLNVLSRDTNHDASLVDEGDDHHVHQDLDTQFNSFANQNNHARDDHEDDVAEDQNLAPEHDFAHDSSTSADEGITAADQAPPPPVHGRKRKRTVKPIAGKSPYINHSGFVVRSSDTQLAQRRLEEPGPSGSEFPFDSNIDVQESPDKLDVIPPVRPQSKARASPPKNRPQRSKTVIDDTDETATPVPEGITMSQYGRPRRQAQRQPGFVETPRPGELAKMSRQSKKK